MTKNYKTKKRGYKKRRPRTRATIGYVNPSRQITSQRRFVKLTYDTGSVGSTTTVSPGHYILNASSLFDPQQSAGGGQPRGRDQMATLYNNYLVHGCSVKVIAQNLTASTCSILSMYPNDSAGSFPANVKAMEELPDARTCYFTTERPCIKTKYYDIAKCQSITKQRLKDDVAYSAGMGADPTNSLYVHVQWININESTSTGHNVRIVATYYVELFEPVSLGAS